MTEHIELSIADGDKEKQFKVKPMDAFKAEAWMLKAGFLLGRELSTIADFKDTKNLIHAICSVSYDEAKPLLDELLGCCYFIDGKFEKRMTDDGVKAMIKSPKTLLKLRTESAKANFGFLLSGNLLASL